MPETDAYAVVAVFEFPDAVERQVLHQAPSEHVCDVLAAAIEAKVKGGKRQIRYEGDRLDAPLHVLLAVCKVGDE